MRSSSWLWWPVVVYVTVLAVLLLVSWQVVDRFVEDPLGLPGFGFAGDGFWEGWVRFDGGWYVGIAEVGYSYTPGQQSPVAFFPGYPLAIRWVGRAIDNVALGGIAVTIACGLASVVLFARWCRDRLESNQARLAVLALALYPYAFYLYGAVYGDALFLLATLLAFVLLERDRPLLAGLAGAIATATRPVGVAVVAGLVIGVIERRGGLARQRRVRLPGWLGGAVDVPTRLRLRALRRRDLFVLVSLAGVAAWCWYLWREFGDPFLFSSVQEAWGQPSSPETWFKQDFFGAVLAGDDRKYAYGLVVQAALAFVALLSVPAVAKRFGWRYGVYTAVLVMLPAIGSQDFQGLGRYLIAAFPCFALLGAELADRAGLRQVLLPCSAAALVVLTAGFAHGIYLS